ncbi:MULTISPECIES: F0F1 ATP synthase subunit B [Cyanophyceae]|uniref:ATP synthase subunit b 2 n=1 Tax=Picosynechococcus sp. (strain ATCC 27264 / PCC 7002 / PR-6) TaxID=32049 RepID=ATPF3_PICP2|nr:MULTISPECIES: F0F1 ATP synthase subunit B [Cyanophyceae]B1XRK5.1 RecName: Full=ATP synthase subunit b 2; AltName: Full=ATP synthase F(0) sector subunit b 2; AltName: Full=ATPase subunit I 2; AltName: Full=F-type ATPase subunit b 2; Short=F-ATPase subunit b 2 [Picosynechococcus sp. PCC 7002]ACB01190.1 ATP synthase b subunit [Picosynechococcus sp. PCC 7002]ANV92216.1 F0F1 ATP synthase subunit B [Picosynechococcus sp. PCC 8807]SMH48035.1 ATP synthase F0 subcomplex B subunit [Picosynechococcus s
MLIDWFTVFAQILNFVILLGLLRWFLYKPILQVMAKRQAQLAEQWQTATDLQAQAHQALEQYHQEQQSLQAQRASFLAAARAAADEERQRQLLTLREDIQAQREAWEADLHQEQRAFFHTLRQQVSQQVVAIARQALRDLANATLEQQVVARFCEQLQHLSPAQRQQINHLETPPEAVFIRTAFPLDVTHQAQIKQSLATTLELDGTPIHFVTVPELGCGIELKLAGQEIVWGLDPYLDQLEQTLAIATR